MYHRGSKYVVSPAEAAELRRQSELGDHLNREIDRWRDQQGLTPFTNAHLKTNSVRDPIVEAVAAINRLGHMLGQMRSQHLTVDSHTPVANGHDPAIKAMSQSEVPVNASPEVQRMIANMNERRLENERRRQRALEYCARHPIVRERVITNSSDEAVQAMSANIGAVAFFAAKREGR